MKVELDKRSLANYNRVMDRKKRDLSSQALKKKASKKGLKPIEKIAKGLVRVRTGKLKDNIRIEEIKSGAEVITDLAYSASEEYRGKPFMRPAANRGAREAFKVQAKIYKKEADKKV